MFGVNYPNFGLITYSRQIAWIRSNFIIIEYALASLGFSANKNNQRCHIAIRLEIFILQLFKLS